MSADPGGWFWGPGSRCVEPPPAPCFPEQAPWSTAGVGGVTGWLTLTAGWPGPFSSPSHVLLYHLHPTHVPPGSPSQVMWTSPVLRAPGRGAVLAGGHPELWAEAGPTARPRKRLLGETGRGTVPLEIGTVWLQFVNPRRKCQCFCVAQKTGGRRVTKDHRDKWPPGCPFRVRPGLARELLHYQECEGRGRAGARVGAAAGECWKWGQDLDLFK